MQFLSGLSKASVQATILAGILDWSAKNRHELNLDIPTLPRHLLDLMTLATGPSAFKYVFFNGRVFFEGWAPPWPSPGFYRSIATAPRLVTSPHPERIHSSVYAVVSLTNRCMFRCKHCYTSHTLERRDRVSRHMLLETIDKMLRFGVGILSLEGGEPLLRYDDLLAALELCRGRTAPYIATTGWSLTPKRARELASRGLLAAQVSLDSTDREEHNAIRRSPKAFDIAIEAIGNLRQAGVFPIIGMLATPDMVESGGLFRFLEFARDVGAGLIQVLDPMPAGTNVSDGAPSLRLDRSQRQAVYDFQVEVNTRPRWRDYPAVSARLYSESDDVAGCGWGGSTTYYIDAYGNVEPCIYTSLSVGNILEQDFEAIHQRMRQLFPRPVGGLCPAYSIGQEEIKARAEGKTMPLPPDETERLAAKISRRPLPALFRKIARRTY